MDIAKNRKLLAGGAAAAFVLGAGAVAGAAVGAGPFERDDSGLDDPHDSAERTGVSTPDSASDDGARSESTQLADLPIGATDTFAAGDAGFVTVTRDADGALRVVAVTPAAGWTFEIEPADEPGEVEVDLRNGAGRVQLSAELEDGVVRIRVRTRGAATPGATLPDGTLPAGTQPRVDNSGPGSLNRGPGSVDRGGDSSGPGSGSDGHAGDGGVDDHGGSSGSGGGDDTGIDDHGGDSSGAGSGSSGSGHGGGD